MFVKPLNIHKTLNIMVVNIMGFTVHSNALTECIHISTEVIAKGYRPANYADTCRQVIVKVWSRVHYWICSHSFPVLELQID